ncbi:hypothetical protein [Kibdelosporangium philippinense]
MATNGVQRPRYRYELRIAGDSAESARDGMRQPTAARRTGTSLNVAPR